MLQIMRITYISLITLLLLLSGHFLHAQTRPLPILEVNPDARTAAMGNVTLGEAQAHYLYTNPLSFLYHDGWLSVSAGGEMYPKSGDAGRLLYGNVGVGIKFARRHAIYAGYRYLGGLAIKQQGRFGETKKTIRPMDMTYDLGYAFAVNDKFGIYATGTLTQTYVKTSVFGGTFGLGANYRTTFGKDADNPYRLNLGVKISDLGLPIAFSTRKSYALPSSFSLGGDVSRYLGETYKFTLALCTRYYFLPSEASLLTLGAGGECTIAEIFSVRAGYEFAQKGMSHYTIGFGASFAGGRADFAYRKATADTGVDTMMCTLSLDL